MRKLVALCLCGLLLSGVASLAAAEKEYNLYDYNPMELQMRWVYALRTSQAQGAVTGDAEVIGDEEVDGVRMKRFRWPSGWVDFYEQTEEGLKRHKDICCQNIRRGVYEPPAIQYPKTMKMGEVYERTALRYNYNGQEDKPAQTLTETLRLSLLGEEDITVPAGTFKGCLKMMSDSRLFDKGNEVQRKIGLGWIAPGDGLVKKFSVDLVGGAVTHMEEAELKEFLKPEPAKETKE